MPERLWPDWIFWFFYWQLTTKVGLICLPLEILLVWLFFALLLSTFQKGNWYE